MNGTSTAIVAAATTAAAQGRATVIRSRGARVATVIGSSPIPTVRHLAATLSRATAIVARRAITSLRGAASAVFLARGAAPVVLVALAVSGCGSSSGLPRAAGPDRSPPLEARPAGEIVAAAPVAPAPRTQALVDRGRKLAVLSPRERVLEVYDARTRERLDRAPAGAGPTHVVAGERGLAYVVDTAGDGLLVFETHGRLRIRRRYPLLGAPYATASDLRNGRLWVTLTARNQLVELATSARPHRLNVYPTVRQPNGVALDSAGRVFVRGEQVQLLDLRRNR
jgi:hypothetical protein